MAQQHQPHNLNQEVVSYVSTIINEVIETSDDEYGIEYSLNYSFDNSSQQKQELSLLENVETFLRTPKGSSLVKSIFGREMYKEEYLSESIRGAAKAVFHKRESELKALINSLFDEGTSPTTIKLTWDLSLIHI